MAVYKNGTQLKTRSLPSIGSSLNSGQSSVGQMQGSFDRMFGGGLPSMSSLESASMRLADAASKRSIDESEASANIQARQAGYLGLSDQQRKMRKRMLEEEEEARRRNAATGRTNAFGASMTQVRR